MGSEKKDRVCVIGAGPSGMSALYYFAKLGAESPEVVCYEKSSNWGGQWNYTWRTGTDEFGESVSSAIYRGMWVNLPKEVTEMAHYTFDKHFGKTIPSFFPASVMFNYLEGYWKSSDTDLSKMIKFSTSVVNVRYNTDTDDFTVVTKDLIQRKTNPQETFGHVIVASGSFSVPNVPEFEGFDNFPGRILHSQQFKGGNEFQGKRVLIVGSGFSAEDVALQCYKYGADHVTISWRTNPLRYIFPSNVEERPLLLEVEGNVAKFKGGSTSEVDAIILCTGYRYGHSFLEDNLRISEQHTVFFPENLYKGMVWLKGGNNKLLYMGALSLGTSTPAVDAQAVWAVTYVTGRNPLSPEAKHVDNLHATPEEIQYYQDNVKEELSKLVGIPSYVQYRGDYIRDIADDTGYYVVIEKMTTYINECVAYRLDHWLDIRELQFTSAYTGNQAEPPSRKWIDIFGDDHKPFV